jgi:hypothetical protein
MDINLTKFQRHCLESLRRIFVELRIDATEEIKGRDETYLRFALSSRGHSFEIYVYEDGADLGIDGKDTAFEIQDYDSIDELAADFLMTVRCWLLGSPPPERPPIWQKWRWWRRLFGN